MVDETEQPEPTHLVRETQTRTVKGGVIVLLITRLVRDADNVTIQVTQDDCVATSGSQAGALVSDFLSQE
jgi:hypothetical protein